jgi:hypothetical protein
VQSGRAKLADSCFIFLESVEGLQVEAIHDGKVNFRMEPVDICSDQQHSAAKETLTPFWCRNDNPEVKLKYTSLPG